MSTNTYRKPGGNCIPSERTGFQPLMVHFTIPAVSDEKKSLELDKLGLSLRSCVTLNEWVSLL
jgi:hypothetical protein